MKRQGRRARLVVSATIAAFIAVWLLAIWIPRIGRPMAAVRVSQAEAMASTRSLVKRLWPERQIVDLTPELTSVRQCVKSSNAQGTSSPSTWQISCEDALGAPAGTIMWNASNGALISIFAGCATPNSGDAPLAQINRSDMRKLLRQWMHDLVGSRPGGPWHEASVRTHLNMVTSDWVAARQTARLCVNSCTGELIVFRLISDGPIAQPAHARVTMVPQ